MGDSSLDIRFESNEDCLFICADRLRLDQLILNLLSNSLQNMTKVGTVTVSVTQAPPSMDAQVTSASSARRHSAPL